MFYFANLNYDLKKDNSIIEKENILLIKGFDSIKKQNDVLMKQIDSMKIEKQKQFDKMIKITFNQQ